VGEELQELLDQLLGPLDIVQRSVILEHDSLSYDAQAVAPGALAAEEKVMPALSRSSLSPRRL